MITEEQKIERLRQLRRVGEAAPDDRLHMRAFCEEAECGTAYCLAGWAAIDPWFREHTDVGEAFEIDDEGYVMPTADDDPFRFLAGTFGIGYEDSERLFGGGMTAMDDPHSVPKAEVLANIDRLIGGLPAERYAVVERRRREEGPYGRVFSS